ncbi:hypothetical protein JHK85_028180 [Glycine max]|nr:hypothetical protein JHK85_028180 [Glycine max]
MKLSHGPGEPDAGLSEFRSKKFQKNDNFAPFLVAFVSRSDNQTSTLSDPSALRYNWCQTSKQICFGSEGVTRDKLVFGMMKHDHVQAKSLSLRFGFWILVDMTCFIAQHTFGGENSQQLQVESIPHIALADGIQHKISGSILRSKHETDL